MRVRATAPGFFDVNKNGHPIDIPVGREFEVPDGLKARWFEPVAAKPAATANPPATTAPPAPPAGAAPEQTGGKPAAPAKPAPTK